MIDTVSIFYPHAIENPHPIPGRHGSLDNLRPIPGWRHSLNVNQSNNADTSWGQQQSYSCDDPDSGYHAYGRTGEYQYHQASLPRLIHGFNGYLIKSQEELTASMDQLFQKAGQLGSPSTLDYHFTRVDLVWQFAGDTAEYIMAHRTARHPRIRRNPTIYEGRSLALSGSEMRICMYDKLNKHTRRNGNVIRIEIQLRGRRLMEELGNRKRVTALNFGQCYQAYRRILLGFTLEALPHAGDIAELLAIGEKEGWMSGGVSPYEIYTANKSLKQIRRIQKRMQAYQPLIHKIDWSQLLPPDHPPLPIEVANPKKKSSKS